MKALDFLSLAQTEFPNLSGLPVSQERVWIVGVFYLSLVVAGLFVDVLLLSRMLRQPVNWNERIARLRLRPFNERQAALLLLLLLTLYLAGSLVLPKLERWLGADQRMLWIVGQSILFHVAGLILVAILLARDRLSWKKTFGLDFRSLGKDLKLGLIFYLGALPFVVFYSLLYQALLRYLNYPVSPQDVALTFVAENTPAMRVYLAFLAVVLAPVFEEILFRGIGLPIFSRRWNMAAAVLATSALFAAIHLHVPSILPLFVIATSFSLGYIYSGSILVPVAMHGLFNGVNVALLMLISAY